jgi:urease accessory protein UreH
VNVEELIRSIIERLNDHENISFGVSRLPVNGLIVRILGYKAEQLFNLLHLISKMLEQAKQKTFLNKVNVA